MQNATPRFSWGALLFFVVLAVVVTWPIAARLSDFSVVRLLTDDLLEAWTLSWDVHAMLAGRESLANIWHANIFYPYPNTLAFSEHLLATAALLMPSILLGSTPLVGPNLGILFTTALTGWGMYLLVTWLTGNRWAGMVAGVAFAIAPYRLGHITQLHLISTHWMPFIFLALARLISRGRTRDLSLLIIFTNLQFFSTVNYAPLVAMGAAIWGGCFLLLYRRQLTVRLWVQLGIFAAVTLALNWPVLKLYWQVSQQLGVIRTLGDARVYGAYLLNYILPMGNSLLYGRWLGLPTHLEYQFPGIGIFVSTFSGVTALLLALVGVVFSFQWRGSLRWVTWAVLLMALLGFVLSFGANENALGSALSPLVARLLPYPYLYQTVSILQGLRVPIRFALLTVFGVSLLAGIGFAGLGRRFFYTEGRMAAAALLACGLLVLEHMPAPLPGVTVPHPSAGRVWLAQHTPPNAPVIELPFVLHTPRSNRDLLREYESALHFRPLVNGVSGFKPEGLKQLGHVFDSFPDWRAFDVLRQLGVRVVVLHQDEYDPAAWDNIIALLPEYLPAIESIHTVGNQTILQLAPPNCAADLAQIQVDATDFPKAAFTNTGPASWIATPRRPGVLNIGGETREFLEPLFVLPGETTELLLPNGTHPAVGSWEARLTNLGKIITAAAPEVAANTAPPLETWSPVTVKFAHGVLLQAVAASPDPRVCGVLDVQLQWQANPLAGETARVELVDRFGRVAVSSQVALPEGAAPQVTAHRLPLAETLPAGPYQLGVHLQTSDGDDIPAVGPDGSPVAQLPGLPLIIRPRLELPPENLSEPINLANNVALLAVENLPPEIHPGDWLRFTLHWQAIAPVPADFTVFTQLIGSDGQVVAQHDNPPQGGGYATSLWLPGEIMRDDYALPVDATANPGDYRLIVGMYDSAGGQRVPVSGGDFIEVGVVHLAEK